MQDIIDRYETILGCPTIDWWVRDLIYCQMEEVRLLECSIENVKYCNLGYFLEHAGWLAGKSSSPAPLRPDILSGYE